MFHISRPAPLVIALSCLLFSGCAVSLGVGVGSEDPEWGHGEHDEEGREDGDDSAELKLRMAELEAESSVLDAEASLRAAEAELAQAHKAMQIFHEGSAPDQVREAELDVERSRVGLDEQRATGMMSWLVRPQRSCSAATAPASASQRWSLSSRSARSGA